MVAQTPKLDISGIHSFSLLFVLWNANSHYVPLHSANVF